MALEIGDYESANKVINDLVDRGDALTQDDLEDLLWAVEELDKRNKIAKAKLGLSNASLLTNEDLRGLEASVSGIRRLYQWIADSSDPPSQTAQNGTVEELNGIRVIPSTTSGPPSQRKKLLLQDPAEESSLRTVRVNSTTRSSKGATPVATTRPGPKKETLISISEETGVSIDDLLYYNPDLESYRSNEPLPGGVKLRIPAVDTSKKGTKREVITTVREVRSTTRGAARVNQVVEDGDEGVYQVRRSRSRHSQNDEGSDDDRYDERRPRSRGRSTVIHHDPRSKSLRSDDVSEDEDLESPRPASVRSSATRLRPSLREVSPATSIAHQKLVEGRLTLAKLAKECHLSIDEILRQNPNLEPYGDHEVIPYHEPIEVRRPDTGRPVADLAGKSQRENVVYTKRGDTIQQLARRLALCSVEELRDLNEGGELDDFSDAESLPEGIQVRLPQSYSDVLRDFRAVERKSVREPKFDLPPTERASPSIARKPAGSTRSLAAKAHSSEAEYYPGEVVEVGTSQVRRAESLEELAEEFGCSIDDIRHCNPETDPFSDFARLPHRMQIRVPRPREDDDIAPEADSRRRNGSFIEEGRRGVERAVQSGRRVLTRRGEESDEEVEIRRPSQSPVPGSRRTEASYLKEGEAARNREETYRGRLSPTVQRVAYEVKKVMEPTSPASSEGATYYTTKRGDTIHHLARRMKVEAEELIALNEDLLGNYPLKNPLPQGLRLRVDTLTVSRDRRY